MREGSIDMDTILSRRMDFSLPGWAHGGTCIKNKWLLHEYFTLLTGKKNTSQIA